MTRVLRALLDQRVQLVRLGLRGHKVFKESLALPVQLVRRVFKDLPDQLVL